MFTSNPCKHPIVFMKDVHCGDLEALLDFMYRGVVHIQKTALSSLLKTAEGLQIRGLGLFAQEAVQQIDSGITATQPGEERLSLTSLEPSVFLSPDRKRAYDSINTTVSSDHDASGSLGNFSEADLDDHSMGASVNHSTQSASSQSMHKKPLHRMIDHPPASVPELPKISDDQLDIGYGISIPAADYLKLRRTNANRYINDLLRYFFTLEVLAMSSLTGGECFANRGKTQGNKNQLDPNIIRVITNDAIRNFPMITEKQVRNAIRRKLNTESRTFRGLGKVSSGVRRPPTKRRSRQTPRPLVSIERSSHAMHSENKTMLQHQPVTPNVTLEKTGVSPGLIFRTKDMNLSAGTLVNRVQQPSTAQQLQQAQQQQQQQQAHQQQQYTAAVAQQQTITTVGGISATAQCISLATSDKRPDDEAAAASAAAYFNSGGPATSSRGARERSPPPSHHTSNSGTPPLGPANLPPSSSPSATAISEKSFNLVKAEVGGGGGAAGGTQYITQEYSYLPHVSQPTAYLSHHISDPAYLRRLEMSQAAAQHSTAAAAAAALSYSYPLPTSESMEPSLHM
ncbi:hypothetical protein HAZT_HAZT010417 [Hyalella azteca]|nr:hypothetical protein HAZT_HAZT010417 [Hyalella azteca]